MIENVFAAGVLADGGWGHMGSGWGWGGLVMLGFWALIVLGVVVAGRAFGSSRSEPDPHRRSPTEILAERFARGEIDEKDYRELPKDVQKGLQWHLVRRMGEIIDLALVEEEVKPSATPDEAARPGDSPGAAAH